MPDQRAIEQERIRQIAESLTSSVMNANFQQVREICDAETEENVRAAAARLVNSGLTGERLSAGRQYIQGVLLEKSNQRLAEALSAVGPTVALLNQGLDRVDLSIKALDERLNRRLGDALDETGQKISSLARGLAAVDGSIQMLDVRLEKHLGDALDETGRKLALLAEGLAVVDISVRKLDESSSRLGRKAFWIAVGAGVFALVQAVAAAVQIWKWMHGQ